jgi:hypothetical protein
MIAMIILVYTLTMHRYITCHTLMYLIAFLHLYKYPLIPYASTKYCILELSPVSTKCTHGATVKLFASVVARWMQGSSLSIIT